MATYRNKKGKLWTIHAVNLSLVESDRTREFSDYKKLFSEAEKLIRRKKKAGFQLMGNLAAEELGLRNHASPEQMERAKPQFGPRASIHSDPWGEVSSILADPEGYDGGTLLIDGDAVIDGDWDLGPYAAVVVLGNCEVRGLLYQFQTEPWVVITGNLTAENLVMAANFDVGGDLTISDTAEFESADGYAHIGGHCQIDTAFVWDMGVTCKSFQAERYVSANDPEHRLRAKSSKVGQWIIGRQMGQQYEANFNPCVLDYQGMEGDELQEQRAAGWAPQLIEYFEMIHVLELPIVKRAARTRTARKATAKKATAKKATAKKATAKKATAKKATAKKATAKGRLSAEGKSFLFTGKLATMTRATAKARVTELGGTIASSVTKTLDYLVVGDDGSPLYDEGKKGSKILAAEKLIAAGATLRIISESDFLS